ncbi:MAG: 1,2-phenylacetyl-CoA epoxidase subunit PaaC [Beijerinckiaceae bacterium]
MSDALRAEQQDPALLIPTLRLADTALVLGHRLSEWASRGPTLEEDIALSNLGLDLIGQARMFYDYAGKIEGKGRDEDALAYLRSDREYRNLLLAEQPNGDFAFTMVRHLLYAAFAAPYFMALARSSDATLAAIAAKTEKEMAYHLRHAGEWVIRLGDGTDESRRRAQDALDELFAYTGELFAVDAWDTALISQGILPDPQSLRADYDETLERILAAATLQAPKAGYQQSGGRDGLHSEHLSLLLAEMQSVHRTHPGAVW